MPYWQATTAHADWALPGTSGEQIGATSGGIVEEIVHCV